MTDTTKTPAEIAASTDSQEKVYARWLRELEDGSLFRFAERASASRCSHHRGSGWMKQLDRMSADLMVSMGRMAKSHLELLDIARAVVAGANPHAAKGEWEAQIFRSAWAVLRGEYDDVERRSGPDVGRLRDYIRPYTVEEKFIVLETLRGLCDGGRGRRLGWCAARFAAEHRIYDLEGREVAKELTR